MGTTPYSPLLALFTVAPGIRRADGRTLSVYLPAHEGGYDARYYDIVFSDVRYRYRDRLDERELEILESELPLLRSHIDIVRPADCAAFAAFSELGRGVLELVTLPAPTVERLEVGDPLLAPALRQIEQFPPALVAVVDKEHARLFGFILDRVFNVAALEGVQVHHSKAGGTSALSNQRKAENRARRNVALAARAVERTMDSGAYQFLYVAGPPEARGLFVTELRSDLRAAIAGHLGMSLDSATLEASLKEELISLRRDETTSGTSVVRPLVPAAGAVRR